MTDEDPDKDEDMPSILRYDNIGAGYLVGTPRRTHKEASKLVLSHKPADAFKLAVDARGAGICGNYIGDGKFTKYINWTVSDGDGQ
ncbi:MAG: hypothetical protein IT489_03360 [Gammaproteobacteria bacterium]|nr:hypothetical protein [Gammaproteobacteria bacterium]